MIIWITGAPGSGKSTLALKISKILPDAVRLDGDDVRRWLTPDCDFSDEGRASHAVRVLRAARLADNAIVSMVSHPPESVDLLILVEGPERKPMWAGTVYTPPKNPDFVVKT